MKKIYLICLALLACSGGFSQITYIANEGFIIETTGAKIAIDALFNTIEEDWCDSPTPEMIQSIQAAKPPFDGIDVIAVTHDHRDHFNAGLVATYLQRNTATKLICPLQVREALCSQKAYGNFSDRVFYFNPKKLQDTTILLMGLQWRILRLSHSPYMIFDSLSGKDTDIHQDVVNLGFRVKFDDLVIFHCGDSDPLAEEEYSKYALQNDSITFAFLDRQFLGKGKKAIEIINQYIQADKIVIMHIAPGNKHMMINYFKDNQNVLVFDKMLEEISIETAKRMPMN